MRNPISDALGDSIIDWENPLIYRKNVYKKVLLKNKIKIKKAVYIDAYYSPFLKINIEIS